MATWLAILAYGGFVLLVQCLWALFEMYPVHFKSWFIEHRYIPGARVIRPSIKTFQPPYNHEKDI